MNNNKNDGNYYNGCIISFNGGHVLQLRSETVPVHTRTNMVLDNYFGQMTPGDDLAKIS